jgi:hypothetical protein
VRIELALIIVLSAHEDQLIFGISLAESLLCRISFLMQSLFVLWGALR